jgi:hypothetical protein
VERSYSSGEQPAEVDPFEFKLDGVTFVCTGTVTLLDISDLATLANEDITSARGAAAVGSIFRAGMEEQYPAFADHVRKHHTHPDVLVRIMNDLVEYVSRGPTGPPSPSLAGRPSTNGSSAADYPWPGLQREIQRQAVPMSDEQIEEIRRRLGGGV